MRVIYSFSKIHSKTNSYLLPNSLYFQPSAEDNCLLELGCQEQYKTQSPFVFLFVEITLDTAASVSYSHIWYFSSYTCFKFILFPARHSTSSRLLLSPSQLS